MNVDEYAKSVPVSVLIPTFNGGATLAATLISLRDQTFQNFEVVISDDGSVDMTVEIAGMYADERFRIVRNPKDRGYSRNLQNAFLNSCGKSIFLLGQDDILHSRAIEIALSAMSTYNVGAVSRPYFWFSNTPHNVVRVKYPLDELESRVIGIHSNPAELARLFSTVDQLSGLLIARRYIEMSPFHEDIFPCHAYPFAAATLSSGAVCVHTYTVAVRTESSQSRHVSSIYDVSPTKTWINWAKNVFGLFGAVDLGNEVARELIRSQWLGLLQIAVSSSSPRRFVIREFIYVVKARPASIFSLRIHALLVACLVFPKRILARTGDAVKASMVGPLRKSVIDNTFIEHAASIDEAGRKIRMSR